MSLLKLSVLLSCFVLTTSVSFAQNKKPAKTMETKSIEMTEKLDKELKLSKTQFDAIKSINNQYLKEKSEVNKKIKALEKEKKELKKERKNKITAVLTEEQKKKQESSKKKKKKKKK